MSTLTGIGNYSSAASYLFSKIDTSNKGYIDEDDLVSAFSSLTESSDTSASDVFAQLDGDSDGKITESEFSSALEALNNQYDASRMQSAMMPPPPPPADDEGFTEEELTSQLEEIGDTDSARSTLIGSILENFEAADTDKDGKVSQAEAMAYAEANNIATSTPNEKTSETDSSSGNTSVSDAKIFQQIMELMRTYGSASGDQSNIAALTSVISTSA